LQISVVHPSELGETELAVWASFQRHSEVFANPFLSPEFTVAAGRFRPHARVAVLSEGSGITGFFPFERRRLGGGAPIAAGLNDCQGLVHAPGFVWDPQQLLRGCRLAAWHFDHLVAGQVPFRPYQKTAFPSPIMDFREGFEAYLASLRKRSPQFLKNLFYKQRKLVRDAGKLRFEYDSRDREEWQLVIRWKSDQYRRTGRSDRFAWPGVRELVEYLLDTRSEGFRGMLSMLYAHDSPVAGFILLCSDDVAVDWFPAYNPEFARYSPGFLARLRVAEAAAATGIRYLEMGRGPRDVYKQRFKSGDLIVFEGRILRRSPAAVCQWARNAPARQLRQLVTTHPRLLTAADRVLYRYGRVRTTLRSTPSVARLRWKRCAADE
jgi:CelD/BcsL family acetyltransferase involved in cellulose biosynthesis